MVCGTRGGRGGSRESYFPPKGGGQQEEQNKTMRLLTPKGVGGYVFLYSRKGQLGEWRPQGWGNGLAYHIELLLANLAF